MPLRISLRASSSASHQKKVVVYYWWRNAVARVSGEETLARNGV